MTSLCVLGQGSNESVWEFCEGKDTCASANDGTCDESTSCALGTDCTDCLAELMAVVEGANETNYTIESGCHVDRLVLGGAGHGLAGVVSCIVLGVAFVIMASMPLCCGLLKQRARAIACVVIPLGIFICFIPLLSSAGACDAIADDVCSECGGCSELDRSARLAECKIVLLVLIHFHLGGWIGICLGITAASLGCCVCCRCCKLADAEPLGCRPVGPAGAVTLGFPVGIDSDKARLARG